MPILSWSAALLVLAGGSLHGAVPLKADGPRARPEQPVTIEGQLNAGEAADPVTMRPAKHHLVPLRKGHVYLIDMMSTDFDAFLRIENPAGVQLAQDDDSGGNLNARIRMVAPDDGNFKIIATAFAFAKVGPGKYTVKVQPLGLPDVRSSGGDKQVHAVGPGGLALEGGLGKDDPRDTVRKTSPCRIYQVRLSAGKTYKIDLESREFDTYLRVENAATQELAKDDDGGEGTNSRLAFRAPHDGVYRVIATSFAAGAAGSYRLRVREE